MPQAGVPAFYLGTHQPHWLSDSPVRLFVSDRRLRDYRTPPKAVCDWSLDSGGFTELSTYGSWDHGPTPAEYVERIRNYQRHVGRLQWAAPQDWMCEPIIIRGGWVAGHHIPGTHLSVAEHQRRTIDNLLTLRTLAPDLPIIPVLQGWQTGDYLRHIKMYTAAGLDLARESIVGVGSVCRRQATAEIAEVLTAIRSAGVPRLHGFGVKALGLRRYGHLLASADSMAWSAQARREPPLPGCVTHKNCANCRRYAYAWANRMAAAAGSGKAAIQLPLFFNDHPPDQEDVS